MRLTKKHIENAKQNIADGLIVSDHVYHIDMAPGRMVTVKGSEFIADPEGTIRKLHAIHLSVTKPNKKPKEKK